MALKYYQSTAEPLGQQARFLDFLAEFDFDLQYRASKNHTNCDALSRIRPCEKDGRMPCKQCNRRITGTHVASVTTRAQKRRLQSQDSQEGIDDQEEKPPSGENPPEEVRTRKSSKRGKKTSLLDRSAPQVVEKGVQDWSSEFLADEQRKDPEIGLATEWVSTGQRPPWEEVKPRGPALCALWRQYESLVPVSYTHLEPTRPY